MNLIKKLFILSVFIPLFSILAQDNRSQIPSWLNNAYFEVNVGAINYPFGQEHLEAGYTLLDAVVIPQTAARLVLAGYDFNKYLSAQLTYMRPVIWVKYKGIQNADNQVFNGSVRMNVGGLTLKPRLPITDKLSIYGEAGWGLITRKGFKDPNTITDVYAGDTVISYTTYSSFLFGAGLKYHINDKWALQICSNYSPASEKNKQPYTSFIGTGFSYNFRPFTEERLQKAEKLGYIHPKQWIQVGYSSNILGYGVNNFVSGKIPIFWGGDAQVRQGLTLNYQRNVFHGPKVFALDWGVEAGLWQTDINRQDFFTLSVYPVFRLNFLHTKSLDAYFYYSVVGPTFISEIMLDNEDTGEHFTFQDNMGAGIFFGEKRNLNAEIKIGHYSNGNIFPENDAVKIPLSLNVGYAF